MIVTAMECALITLKAAMRIPMITKGDERGQREAVLMVSEKVAAVSQARQIW